MNAKKTRELNPAEIKYIFDFCKKWDVLYVDLRLELVDHIASQISDIWKNEPELSFKDAFHRVYKSFGVFGLLNVVEEHQNIVLSRYKAHIKKGFIEWFTPPRVIGSLLLFGILLTGFSLFSIIIKPAIVALYISLVIAGVYFFVKSKRLSRKIHEEKTMLLSTPRYFFWSLYLIYFIPMQSVAQRHILEQPLSEISFSTTGNLLLSIFFLASIAFVSINLKIIKLAELEVEQMRIRLDKFFHVVEA